MPDHDLFLSYSSADAEWVRKLAYDLEQRHGLKCFLDSWDIRPGDNIRIALRDGIRASKRIGVVVSPHSVKSGWVELEHSMAAVDDPSNRSRRLIPIYRATCSRPLHRIPEELGILSYIDFRDDSCYDDQLRRLADEVKDVAPPRVAKKGDPKTEEAAGSDSGSPPIRVTAFDVLEYAPNSLWKRVSKLVSPPHRDTVVCELRVANDGPEPVWIEEAAIVAYRSYWDGILYSSVPYSYELNIRCTPIGEDVDLQKIDGLIRGDDDFGRHVLGVKKGWMSMHYEATEVWFPLYCELPPQSRRSIRLLIRQDGVVPKTVRRPSFSAGDLHENAELQLACDRVRNLFENVAKNEIAQFGALPEEPVESRGSTTGIMDRELGTTESWTLVIFRPEGRKPFGARLRDQLLV